MIRFVLTACLLVSAFSYIKTCPDGSLPSLRTTQIEKGEIFSLDDTIVYHVGNSKNVLIMFEDIYGIRSGRHFSVADAYAEKGFNVYLPELLTNPYNETGSIPDAVKSQDYAIVEKRFSALLQYLADRGIKEFYANGFCWGAYMAFRLSAKFDGFKGIAGCHPALGISGLFNQTQTDLVQNVRCPAFLYPASNDPSNIKEGGELIEILATKFGKDKTGSLTFVDELHGWVTRGDIKNATVRRDVERAIDLSSKYLLSL